MANTLQSKKVQDLLAALYEDSRANDPIRRKPAMELGPSATRDEFYKAMSGVYMAIGSEFGNLLYTLIRISGAKSVVEFGTSFGVSTIYLAAALKDSGGGKVITTEYHAEKVQVAKNNIEAAGLSEFVEFRVGDATQSLKENLPPQIDMIFLDGPKDLYFPVLKILEPNLKSGGVLASDNTDHDGLEGFLAYLKDSRNGYITSPILTKRGERAGGHEISFRI